MRILHSNQSLIKALIGASNLTTLRLISQKVKESMNYARSSHLRIREVKGRIVIRLKLEYPLWTLDKRMAKTRPILNLFSFLQRSYRKN